MSIEGRIGAAEGSRKSRAVGAENERKTLGQRLVLYYFDGLRERIIYLL